MRVASITGAIGMVRAGESSMIINGTATGGTATGTAIVTIIMTTTTTIIGVS
jgi:hypothetical protein